MPRNGLILALTLVLGACAGAPSKTATHEGLARDPGNMPRGILVGVADKTRYYQLTYFAPKLHYFDKYQADFARTWASFKLSGAKG